MLSQRHLSKTKSLALLSLFAVIYTVLRLIPTFPMIGVSATFYASDIIAPLYGLILGPYIGGGSIVLGTFLAFAFGRPPLFLGLDFLPAAVGAVSLGFLVKRRFRSVILLNLLLTGVFLINPLTLIFVGLPNGLLIPFNWLHLVALTLLASPLSRKAVDWVASSSPRYLSAGLAVLCFIGTLMQHLTGALLFESILGLVLKEIKPEAWPTLWTTIFYVYPIERIGITLLSTLIGSGVITALRFSGMIVGHQGQRTT